MTVPALFIAGDDGGLFIPLSRVILSVSKITLEGKGQVWTLFVDSIGDTSRSIHSFDSSEEAEYFLEWVVFKAYEAARDCYPLALGRDAINRFSQDWERVRTAVAKEAP